METNADNLIEKNLKLVHAVCHRFTGEYDDLFQIGCIGLIKAARTFDKKLGYSFSTYATPIIRNEILMSFRRKRIATISLDDPISEDDNGSAMTLMDTLASGDDIEYNAIDSIEMKDKTELLKSLLSQRYLDLLGSRLVGKKQNEIAKQMGCSRAYVNKMLMDIGKVGRMIDRDYQTGSKTRIKKLGRFDEKRAANHQASEKETTT